MVTYVCEKCNRTFLQKSHYDDHQSRKRPCKKDNTIDVLVEKKVKEALTKTNKVQKIDLKPATIETDKKDTMDYSKKTREELIAVCKEKGIKGYSGKKKDKVVKLILDSATGKSDLLVGRTINTNASDELATNVVVSKNAETNLELLERCLKTYSMNEVSDKLNLCVGTIRRWQELKDVPPQYTFDLYKILGIEVDYSKFSSSSKDQFFTPTLISKRCWNVFTELVNVDITKYTFIEPSAGDGSFMKVLPKGSIGLDIEPRAENIQKQDYLSWKPLDTNKKYIVFGNPPFGLRGHLALNFINHSYEFADYVCFILPQLFESDGKGSPRKRVNGYNLLHSESLSAMFYSPDNQEVKVNGVFQIWSKFTNNPKYEIAKQSEEKMKVYSLSDGGTVASTRNKNMIDKCDLYLPSTCFGKENMKLYTSFDKLPGKKGYGVVFFKNKEANILKAQKTDWSLVAFLSTNSAYNLRTSLIFGQFV